LRLRGAMIAVYKYTSVHANKGKETSKDTLHLKNKCQCQNTFRLENRIKFPALRTVMFWDHLPMGEHESVTYQDVHYISERS